MVAKKAPKVEQEITGPSSEPTQPKFTLKNNTAVSTVRVASYAAPAAFIMQGLDVNNIWHPSVAQGQWALAALTVALGYAVNVIEQLGGRRWLGVAR